MTRPSLEACESGVNRIRPDRVITQRELNRTTLSRQMLLRREDITIPAALERLVGLQAQAPQSPYVGLWTRLPNFRRENLARLIEDRTVVKATFMRATLHLVTAADFARFRMCLHPALVGAAESISKTRGGLFDLEKVLSKARQYLSEKPRSFADISDWLSKSFPDHDVGAMRYTVRTHLPLVQVPIRGGWSFSNKPEFTLAESWISGSLSAEDRTSQLVLRYLAAFGPASVADAQTWSGLKLKEIFEKLRPKLRVYRDENRRELFDLPEAVLPDADVPAPVRFLPEYDNLLLAHSVRTRVLADEFRKKVFLPGLRVAASFLVDGFVAGVCKVERVKQVATLMLEPFAKLSKRDRTEVEEEGERLLRFVQPEAESYGVNIGKQG
ncbi:MAG: winged helix DNA-binding domain-containing protein [Terriglobia bacterium]